MMKVNPAIHITHHKFTLTLFLLTIQVCFFLGTTNQAFSQNLGNGFLSIISSGQVDYNQANIDDVNGGGINGKLRFLFLGAAPYYDIITELTLFDDIIRVRNQYTGKTSFLNDTSIYYFTFFSLNLNYTVLRYKVLQILVGGKVGHYGFLSNLFPKNPYFLYLAPIFQTFVFIGNYMALELKTIFNIPLYYPRTRTYPIFFNNELNFLFDYQGHVKNPVAGTILFIVGLKYDLLYFKYTDNREILAHYISPQFSIAFTF